MTASAGDGSAVHRDQGRNNPKPPGQAVADGGTLPAAEGQVRIRFLGSGDNFGSGGRFQTCIHVDAGGSPFLIDCGASSLIPMKRAGIRSDRIDVILISHLHGDHFGGIPFFILDAQLISRREAPLRIAGPPGLTQRIREAMEVFYPGSSGIERKFAIEYLEMKEDEYTQVGDLAVLPARAVHGSGAPSCALRVECAGKVIAYSGDTEWTDALLRVADNADLFICECYAFEKAMRNHLNYRTLMGQRHRLGCKRLILTHMGEEMLSRLGEATVEAARDGLEIVL
ncbi:MAG: MBL fold metallo-hydrolase [Thermodesulfobacteriota bacterium]